MRDENCILKFSIIYKNSIPSFDISCTLASLASSISADAFGSAHRRERKKRVAADAIDVYIVE
jgi:hypothetical protein